VLTATITLTEVDPSPGPRHLRALNAAQGLRVLGFAQRQIAQADDGAREAGRVTPDVIGLAALA